MNKSRVIIFVTFILSFVLLMEVCTKKNSLFKTFLYNSKDAEVHLKVVTTALKCDQEPQKNRDKIINTISRIKQEYPQTELIVFGETILGWFYKSGETKEYHRRIAETIPGITTRSVSKSAEKHKVYIVFGITEKMGGRIFNSLVVINPMGKIIKVQRKKNIKNPAFDSGTSSISFVEIKGIKTGLVICYDMNKGNTISTILKNRPGIVIFSVAEYPDKWDKNHSFGYGYLNKRLNSWLVWSNRVGNEDEIFWDGFIGVSNPLGDICIWKSGQEQYLYYDIGVINKQSGFKKVLRDVYMKLSLSYHILKNINIAIRYVNNGAPLRWWMYWQFWFLIFVIIPCLIIIIYKKKKKSQLLERNK